MEDRGLTPIEGMRFVNSEGEIMPWLTLPCLQWLQLQDLKDKKILEFGSGDSTLWFAKRCKHITTVETNEMFYNYVKDEKNVTALMVNELEADYFNVLKNKFDYDIVIVDGVFRDETLAKVIPLLQKKGGIIIADNWQQLEVWVSDYAKELMKDFDSEIYIEPGRERTWKTTVFKIKKQ